MKIEHFLKVSALCYGIIGVYSCRRRRISQPTPVFLPGESRGQRSLVGCCPLGRTELGTTEANLHVCIGEGNGNPVQCSCLENPGDGRAWWAAVYGVAQSWTRLKRLSSRGSSSIPAGNLPRTWRRNQHHCVCRISLLTRT